MILQQRVGETHFPRGAWAAFSRERYNPLQTASRGCRSFLYMANAAIKKARPKYLSLAALLFEIRLPLPGWVSILHRVSGALLFVATVWLLFLLDRSLSSEAGFESIRRYTSSALVKIALLVLIWCYCHHFCAGIRFLFLDIHKGIDKDSARRTSIVVIVAGLALTALFGARLL